MIIKIKIIGRKAQASVEYMLMIALMAGIVLSLTQFSGAIESRLVTWKLGARNQIAGLDQSSSGTYDIERKMFETPGITLKASSGGSGGGGGQGGGSGSGKGRGNGNGASGNVDSAGNATDVNVNAPQKKNQEDKNSSNYTGSRRTSAQEEADLESTRRPTENSYSSSQKAESASGKTAEKEEGVSAEDEAKDGYRSNLIRKRHNEDIARSKTFAEKDWSIGKFLIILLVLLFFIFIILKAKQARD
ncbi:MAG: hypothetical protein WCQ47_05405 [bacterium]